MDWGKFEAGLREEMIKKMPRPGGTIDARIKYQEKLRDGDVDDTDNADAPIEPSATIH